MAITNSISQQLMDFLATRDLHPETLGKTGTPADVDDAKTFTFDYKGRSGKNYGTMVIVLDVDNDMKIMYGDNLGRTMEGEDKDGFFDFISDINRLASRNRWTHTISDIAQLKYTMQGLAAIQEGLFEGYYGTRKISYAGQPTEARLQIVHNRTLGENDARYRHIDKIFIETADGERFKLGSKSLIGAKAMLEHVRQGGKPYDIRGCHINEMINEISVLSRFNRASANRILEGSTEELITEAQVYYRSLRENLKHLCSSRGYKTYFESWHPATISEQDELVENIKTLFVEQTLDSRIEAALPLLARIQQKGQEMKELEIFESWIANIGEGTWALPETPEQVEKLKTLMTKELIVGPDATNATEQLYDIIGDDILFDRLNDLAARDARANAWNDTEVMNRLRELGIDTPDIAPVGAESETQPADPTTNMPQEPAMAPVREADDIATFESINAMRKAAGLPVAESRNAEGSEYIDELVGKVLALEKPGMSTNSDNDDFYKAVYDELIEIGMTPTAARYKINYDEDFMSDVASAYHHFTSHPEVKEGAAVDAFMMGKSPAVAHFADQLDKSTEVKEGSCNMTMEGEYCPEHGLIECGTVAGGMAPVVMGEQGQEAFVNKHHNDAMNYNAAMTGSYYEAKDDPLARIKSLALTK